MEGPANELRDKVLGTRLTDVRHEADAGWMTLRFEDDAEQCHYEWSVKLDAAVPLRRVD